MKKLIVLSMAFFFSFSFVFGQIKQQEKEVIKETKKEIKEGKGDVKLEKKDLKSEKKELTHLEGNDVSDISKDNFYADFGNVPDVKWERDGIFDRATFTKDGKEVMAYYDFDAGLVGTTHHVTFADIPEKGQSKIEKDYKDYDVQAVIFYNDNEVNDSDMILYGTQFAHEDNYFVEMAKDNKMIILRVNPSGEVFYFMDPE